MRAMHLGIAALFGALAVLTKQEFGFACLVLLAFEVVASCFDPPFGTPAETKPRRVLRRTLACAGSCTDGSHGSLPRK